MAFSPDGKLLASASGPNSEQDRAGEVKVWDVAGKRELATLRRSKKGYKGNVQAVAFSPDGEFLAAGYGDQRRQGECLTVVAFQSRQKRLLEDRIEIRPGLIFTDARF